LIGNVYCCAKHPVDGQVSLMQPEAKFKKLEMKMS